MKNKIGIFVFILLTGCVFASCDSYIDVVPDNVATIDNAFVDKFQAEKYLYTLYAYLPRIGHPGIEGTFDDLTWAGYTAVNDLGMTPALALRNGNRVNDPYLNGWEGRWGGTATFQAIRDCNILIEKIDEVRDMMQFEKFRWKAEAKFLKAYHHFRMLQQYGPVPIIDVNLPITATDDEVMIERLPVDMVFDYIVRLLDEAALDLPPTIENRAIELGRVTQAAALALKAKVLVTAASPLYNGNTLYASFTDRQGQPFFNAQYDHEKWEKAVVACKEAIDLCDSVGYELYEYVPLTDDMSEETSKIVQVGQVVTDRWNAEHLWSMVWSSEPNIIDEYTVAALEQGFNRAFRGVINPTMKAAEMFYSNNGVPIEEDLFYDYDSRYDLTPGSIDDNKYVQTGIQTARLHLNREYRFYGSIAFDGGYWLGLGYTSEAGQWPVNALNGNNSGQRGRDRFSCTGFFIKKLLHYLNTVNGTDGGYTPLPVDRSFIRLADLYLLYAEALNEYQTAPNEEVWEYVNRVRKRAGLETVQDAWSEYSKNPDKYKNQSGAREIIRRERSIELMFEGHRLFDLKRWNIATAELTGPVKGWNYMGTVAEDFYQVVTVDNIQFTDRDVLAPIPLSEMIKNRNLIQNPGW